VIGFAVPTNQINCFATLYDCDHSQIIKQLPPLKTTQKGQLSFTSSLVIADFD